MMRLLVTGGAGFIGSNFIHHVLSEQPAWEVVNFDKLTYAGNLENLQDVEHLSRYSFVQGDVTDRESIAQLFEECKPQVVVNFAAESHVDRSLLDAAPFVESNIKGTQVLLEAARTVGVERFVQVSTDEVYGSLGPEGAFTEESHLAPNSPYAASKAAGDLLCRAYWRSYAVPVIVTRSSNNYGPFQFPEKLIPLMIRNALLGEPLPLYGEGKQVRDWLYVEDNCRAIVAILLKGKAGEVYNIGGGEERTNVELVKLLCQLLAQQQGRPVQELESLISFVKDRPGHDFRYALQCRKLEQEVGWRPNVSLEEGLAMTVRWYIAHRDWTERVVSQEYQEYYARVYQQGWR